MELTVDFLGKWRADQEEAARNVKLLHEELSHDAIHDLRVAIKRLRAYTRLLSELNHSTDEVTLLKETKGLFHILGKHREWEIIEDKFIKTAEEDYKKLPLLKGYVQFSKEQITPNVESGLKSYGVNELEAIEKRVQLVTTLNSPEELAIKCISVSNDYVAKIEKAAGKFKKNVHKIRKLLKKILYWIQLFPVGSLYTQEQVEMFDQFLDKLGKWHDYQVILEKTNYFKLHHIAPAIEEYAALEKAEAELQHKMDKLYNEMDVAEIVRQLKKQQSG